MAPLKTSSDGGQKAKSAQVASKTRKFLSRKQINALLIDSEVAITQTVAQLETVRALAAKAGLSIECTTLPSAVDSASSTVVPGSAHSQGSSMAGPRGNAASLELVSNFTGGHSNTDHSIVRTGDPKKDRLSELRRNYLRRYRDMKPEVRGETKWNKPRLPGERRRRIQRDRDSEEAPPEPPMSGFIIFVSLMTTKIRHDRPDVQHDQAKGNCGNFILADSVLHIHAVSLCCLLSFARNLQNMEGLSSRRARLLQ